LIFYSLLFAGKPQTLVLTVPSGCRDLRCNSHSKQYLDAILDQFKSTFTFSPRMDESGVPRQEYERDAILLQALYAQNPPSVAKAKQALQVDPSLGPDG
jgi:hypothetical protein